jgi:ADP-ribose pyrophosphatase YjhB (NUDIX family)
MKVGHYSELLMVKKIPESIFVKIKNNIPLSCVDIILKNDKNEFLLVKRSIEPYKNRWCLPGGIVKRGEKLENKIKEIAKKELGITLQSWKPIGFYEKIYSSRHDISHCYTVTSKNKEIKLDFQAKDARFFSKIPKNTAKFHIKMLEDVGFR